MNKIIKCFDVFFLLLVLILSGCGNSATKWSHMYQAEGDQEVISEEITDVTIDDETGSTEEEQTKVDNIENATVYVYICGAVVCPGVYELPAGSRVVQAIEAAGGLREDADSLLINQASIVEDGEQIRIYTKEEATEMEFQENIDMEKPSDDKINLNRASADELMTLPGIGVAKAEAIIAYRDEQGMFSSIKEIMNIPGIKEAVFSKIKDKITV